MKAKSFKWVSVTTIKGKTYWRFRRTGYDTYYFKAAIGTKAFEREYAACLEREPITIGAGRIEPGSVSDAIARYYADNAYLDLRASTQTVYRGVLDRFGKQFGDVSLRRFDADRIARLMTSMRDKPHAAARLRKLLTQLFIVARRARLVPYSFNPVGDTKPPKAESEGYHRWSEEELALFEATYALGTKPRLAYSLLLYAAQRSGDVRLMTHSMIADGRIRLAQSKTSAFVDVPIVAPLREALDAGPLGARTLLETRDGEPFTPKGFYNMLKKACIAASIPHCSPHGLRKSAARRCREAGCSNEEGMAITGHKTEREYLRYAGDSMRATHADAAMVKVLARRSENLAKGKSQVPDKALKT
ncbi:tyrosine-type recombinase/integrase [uncultured Novosphingobium sp.]|uniref:tyrosine-type recombinase/integrase n=1 Tax=uncultured Novosphingobium sp. TaxID=292277 RepID=UPI0037490DD9